MAAPRKVLDLGVTLRPEHTAGQHDQLTRLATRLGYDTIWLPVDAARTAVVVPDDLARADRAVALGLVLDGDPATLPDRIGRLRADPRLAGVWWEIHAPVGLRDRCVDAIGGLDRWRERVIVPWPDSDAAGLVVPADRLADRMAVRDQLAAPVPGRPAGRPPHRTVALTVSIGRTTAEARARADRDRALSGPRHPEIAGLFGTLEQAQEQILDLAGQGADAVRAVVADEWDVADLLAQLRAVAVGPAAALRARPD